MGTKRCYRCGNTKPAGEFTIDRSRPSGLDKYCRPCQAERRISRRGKDTRIHGSALRGREQGRSTAAGELMVQADLSRRGFEVTVPVSPTARHDLHVELPSVGWKGVQVKVCSLNPRTGVLYYRNHPTSSPLLAGVHPPTGRIEYLPGSEPVPEELLT